MANIQLYIENELADFDKKAYITLQKEFQNEQELIVKEIEYSYTIEIPTSARNKKIFGFIDSFDVPNKFARLYNAELYVDEILILKGKLKLNEIDKEYFKGNLYNPQKQTVSDILGDRMLNEIQPHMKLMNSLTDYTETNNYVMDWGNYLPPLEYRDKHVCYPYTLYSLPMNEADAAMQENLDHYTQNLEYGKHTISTLNVFPAYNVLSVLKDMFATEGYNVQGNIFDDEKFKDLYQTFQYDYSKFIDERNSPYHLKFSASYTNLKFDGDKNHYIPKTLQICNLWSEDGYYGDAGDDKQYFDGNYRGGVDCPLVAGDDFTKVYIDNNDQHIMTKGSEYGGYAILVPKSGWYRIHCDGTMQYTIERSDTSFWAQHDGTTNIYGSDQTEMVGGMFDEADNTSLEQQPFEFQIKKGNPFDSPQLYSFNSGIPCMPTHYSQNNTVISWDGYSGVKFPSSDNQRYYGKNGKATIIKDYSDKPISDFVCGARLGGALFSKVYDAEYYGYFQAANRFALMGELLALPRADKRLTLDTHYNDTYFQMSRDYDCNEFEYSKDTAQVLLRDDSYGEFQGYNKANDDGSWDTTTNYRKRSYSWEGGFDDINQSNTATTFDNSRGHWNINTVVWLEKGDNISFEVVMPLHHAGHYTCCHSEWTRRVDYINATSVSFDYEMAYINDDKTWYPNASSPIPQWNHLSNKKETNVNQFLPSMKCNDYLTKFLQTFNLQLTMPNKNTFSIDYAMNNNLMGNIISIDDLASVNDAEFKALDLPSSRQLSWKIDKTETGYYDGNKSPYKTESLPWYDSGYTGSITITNETNTSGTIEKKESPYSYNWYKTIRFINGRGLTPSQSDVQVISDKTAWDSETTYYNVASDNPKTSFAMRLFFLGKDADTKLYKHIEFKYDELRGNDMYARLVLPTNSIISQQNRKYVLDYNNLITNNHDSVKTITDIFFNLYVQSGYEVDVPVILSNDMYSKINGGTLIKFNDGLYKIKAVEGHDVGESEPSTMSLLTLK